MDLHTHQPYPLLKHGLLNIFPSLQQDIKTDVAIIGAGISGALVAWELARNGIQCTIVDKRHAATGSTAASTSLIQYEIDTPLHVLQEKVGKQNAIKSYRLCLQAIDILREINNNFGLQNHFSKKQSLQYASYKTHVKELEKEFTLRKQNNFLVEWLDEKDIQNKFGFTKPAALLNNDAAQMDAYLLTHNILKTLLQHCSIYDHTEVTGFDYEKNGITLTTKNGNTIKAKKLVMACGYEAQNYLPKQVEQLHSTYVILSEPLETKEHWYHNCHIWETASPYLYIRTTEDNRIIVGGKDTKYLSDEKQEQMLNRKEGPLLKAFSKLFPHIPFTIDFSWAGAFAATKDGLPYIGSIPQRPHTYFALGFGGNGITFSALAAQFICAEILGKPNKDMQIFSFDR